MATVYTRSWIIGRPLPLSALKHLRRGDLSPGRESLQASTVPRHRATITDPAPCAGADPCRVGTGTTRAIALTPADSRARCGSREGASDMRPRGPRTKAARSASFEQPACRRALALAGDSLASVVPCQPGNSAAASRKRPTSGRRRPIFGCGDESRSAPPSCALLSQPASMAGHVVDNPSHRFQKANGR